MLPLSKALANYFDLLQNAPGEIKLDDRGRHFGERDWSRLKSTALELANLTMRDFRLVESGLDDKKPWPAFIQFPISMTLCQRSVVIDVGVSRKYLASRSSYMPRMILIAPQATGGILLSECIFLWYSSISFPVCHTSFYSHFARWTAVALSRLCDF
jgi:hypothetical protein